MMQNVTVGSIWSILKIDGPIPFLFRISQWKCYRILHNVSFKSSTLEYRRSLQKLMSLMSQNLASQVERVLRDELTTVIKEKYKAADQEGLREAWDKVQRKVRHSGT